jgi:hypothetical protein
MALNLIGMFYNLFLPGHVSGEIVKIFKLTKVIRESSKSIISIAMDRLMSILPRLAIISFCLILNLPLFIDYKFIIGVLALTLFILLFIVIISGSKLSSALEKLSTIFFQKISLAIQRFRKERQQGSDFQIKEGSTSLWGTLKIYQKHRFSLWVCFCYGLISHILESAHFYLIALALNTKISFGAILWILAIVVVVQMIPISISGIGVREGTFVFLLGHYGILPTVAFSLSLIIFFFQILIGGIGGFIEIWTRKVSHNEVV